MEELLPTVERLAGPDPEAGGDPDDETHEVLDHKHLEVGLTPHVPTQWTGDGVDVVARTHVHVPRGHPVVEVALLVEQAGDHDQCWHLHNKQTKKTPVNSEILYLQNLKNMC